METSKNISLKKRLYTIIYEADTKAGRMFDILLLLLILFSIIVVIMESVESVSNQYPQFFNISEWVITILFTVEYIFRISVIEKPKSYIFSFYGVIDFLSTIPKYLSLFFAGATILIALRALRLLRVFKILKLSPFVGESKALVKSLKASSAKISVFLLAVMILTIILGALMYTIENGHNSGFDNIPKSMYWAIVTLTTVGYGDIAPVTPLGQIIASIIMVLGYGIIAVPTGIVSAEYAAELKNKVSLNTQVCPYCNKSDHHNDAKFCNSCGEKINQ